MLLNPKALLEEDGSVDHDIDVVLGLCQRVVVVIHIHLHRLAQSLHDNNSYLFSKKCKKNTKTWKGHLQSMVVLISLAWWHSQIILACQREDNLDKSANMGSPGSEEKLQKRLLVKKQTVATYHEIDGSGDIVDMADGGLGPHEVEGGRVCRGPQVGKPSLAPGPVRDVSDSTHAGERPESSESSSFSDFGVQLYGVQL